MRSIYPISSRTAISYFTLNIYRAISNFFATTRHYKTKSNYISIFVLKEYDLDEFDFICQLNIYDIFNRKNLIETIFSNNIDIRQINNCYDFRLYPVMLGFIKLTRLLDSNIIKRDQLDEFDLEFINNLNKTDLDIREIQFDISQVANDVFNSLKPLRKIPNCLKLWCVYAKVKAEQLIIPKNDTNLVQGMTHHQWSIDQYYKNIEQEITSVSTFIPNLTTGNCMNFASGLKKYLGTGNIIELKIDNVVYHYALEISAFNQIKYFDGTGMLTSNELLNFNPKLQSKSRQIHPFPSKKEIKFDIWAEELLKNVKFLNEVDYTTHMLLKNKKLSHFNLI